MTFDHDAGQYNVHSTLRAWLYAQLVANKPPTVASVSLNVEHPQQPIVPPMWSAHFLGEDSDYGWQGGNVDGGLHGGMRYGILEVNCWVSRKVTGWLRQLEQMQDAVTKAVTTLKATGSGIIIRDFYGNEGAPDALGYRVIVERVEGRMPPTDPNPDIERRRLLIFYHYTERA